MLIGSSDQPLPFEDENEEEEDAEGFLDRYLPIPHNGSKDSYQDMVDFVKLVSPSQLKQDLENALEKRRPFRHFKEIINGSDEKDRWYEFSERCCRGRVFCWLGMNNIWLPKDQEKLDSAYKAGKLMDKRLLLAAELYNYSYANYEDHLGIGNIRFDEMMPQSVDILEQDAQEKWDDQELADALEIDVEEVSEWRSKYQKAKDIIYAANPAESFRISVKQRILSNLKEGLTTEQDINTLVRAICYCAADLAFLLDLEGKELSDYSRDLRKR